MSYQVVIAAMDKKYQLSFHNRPFLDYQLAHLAALKFEEVLVLTHPKHQSFTDWINTTKPYGLNIRAISSDLNATRASSMIQAVDNYKDPFLLIDGPQFLQIDFWNIIKSFDPSKYQAMMCIQERKYVEDVADVLYRNGSIQIYHPKKLHSAMNHRFTGISIMTKAAFSPYVNRTKVSLTEIYQNMIGLGSTQALEVRESLFFMHTLQDISAFNQFVSD